jgi:DNA-directed RNA polymerase specialized sigma24 family protein
MLCLEAITTPCGQAGEKDPRKSQVVELRFFGGLNIKETAEVLNISSMTVQREWRWAKAYLHREITKSDCDEAGTLAENL